VRFTLDFHPLVRIDLAEASTWYERQERGVGVRLETEAKEMFRRLSDQALLFAVRFHDIRRMNLRVFPFGVFYFITGETVVVLGVFHGARDTREVLTRRRETYA
jgi:plasmid stabilization system protein ParE